MQSDVNIRAQTMIKGHRISRHSISNKQNFSQKCHALQDFLVFRMESPNPKAGRALYF